MKAALMLKIQRTVDGQRVVFTLSGRIEAEQVAKLQRLLALEAAGVSLVLDLHEVELVDREAVRFLAQCEAEGTTLVHCPAYIRKWIERERAQP
jgi:anti-anti-sigma regulatory factor